MKTVSVIIPNYNDSQVLAKSLKAIRNQSYDQKKIEIVVADGGSTDNSLELCKKYGAKVIRENTGSPEGAKGVAIKKAKNELLLIMDSDTVMPNKYWLKTMVEALRKEPRAVAAYTWRYTHKKKDKILNRYFALFGANDPVAYYLGRQDRQSYLNDEWNLIGEAEDKVEYFLVRHSNKRMPPLGANGFLTYRKYYKEIDWEKGDFFHSDINWDLIESGKNEYVVVKNDIRHISGESFWKYFGKRYKYLRDVFLRDYEKRRYHVYDQKQDKLRLICFVVASLTLVYPIYEAIKGYGKKKDLAWFLHPIMCLGILIVYGFAVIENELKK